MALFDYISPARLKNEGYINKADSKEMFDNIDKEYLKEQGWFDLSSLNNVPLSIHMAAQVVGVHATTLTGYVARGVIRTDSTGHIAFLDALRFNYKKAKADLMKTKTHIKNK